VLGEPGIGKTRLLMEFQAHLKDTAHHWLLSRCAADGAGSFLSPIRETLSEWAGIGTGQDPAAALEKLQAALPGANAPSAAVTCRALCRLLDIPPAAHEPWLHGTPEQQKNLIFEAVRDWLESLAHSAPLVYVVEDLHWADSSTLELLDYLRRALAGSHVAMVLAQRQEGPVPPWLEGDGVEVMALAPLSGEDAGRLVASSSTRLDGRTVGRIVERAGGIPLFLQELARVADEGDNEARPPEAEAVLPGRVRDLFSARLDKLGDSKPIAGVAAVIGHEFSADLLGKVAKLEPGELAGHLRKLTDTAIIAKINEGGYAFKHALIRDAALANLLRHRRRDHHARVAECLEADYPDECRARPERLAHHWGKAQVVGRALPYYVQAASRARAVYANAEALGLYLEALTLVGGAQAKPGEAGLRPLLLDAHEGLGDVQILLRRNHEAARAFTMAIDTAETSDRVRRARLNRKVGMASREEARHGLPYLHGALGA
jgi:predicted ATPase